jgi:hypothetical protein
MPPEPTPADLLADIGMSPARLRVVVMFARLIVSAGVVVGIVAVARRFSGPVPIAHSHLEPPLSIPP